MDDQSKPRGIDRAAWEKALSDVNPAVDDPRAITMTEFRAMSGLSKDTAMARMNRLVEIGKAKRVQVYRRDSTGRRQLIGAFVLTDQKS